MRVLDLFCGEGGAGEGYRRAGFEVVGVEVDPLRSAHTPYPTITADVRDMDLDWMETFDLIHASPPCQPFTMMNSWGKSRGMEERYPDLVAWTRSRLEATGVPFVIENVIQAPIRSDVKLCGTSFGLQMWRHRGFELGNGTPWMLAPPCNHKAFPYAYTITGGFGGSWQGERRAWVRKPKDRAHARELMDMPWATIRGMAQAIPPAYTEWIGTQIKEALVAS